MPKTGRVQCKFSYKLLDIELLIFQGNLVSFRQNSLPIDHKNAEEEKNRQLKSENSDHEYIGKSTNKSEIWKRYQAQQEETLMANRVEKADKEEEAGELVQNVTVDSTHSEYNKQRLQLTEKDHELQDNDTTVCGSPPSSQVCLAFFFSSKIFIFFYFRFRLLLLKQETLQMVQGLQKECMRENHQKNLKKDNVSRVT